MIKVKAIVFFFLLLLLSSACLCTYSMESDSSEDNLSLIKKEISNFSETATIPATNLLLEKGKTKWADGSLNIFPFASGQGNFILLKCRNRIMIIDGGMQAPGFSGRGAFYEGRSPLSWDEFLVKNNDILNEIFSEAKISAVLVTHADSDHYDWLGGVFNFAFEKNSHRKLEGVYFFLGGRGKDFEYCKKISEERCENCYFYIREISQNSIFKKKLGKQIVTLDRKLLEYVKDSWVRWVLYRLEDPECNNGYDNDEIESILSHIMNANISILSPIPVILPALDNNSNSLVVSINFGVGTVLFTGDATGNTMDAIYGDTKNPDSHIAEVSRRNRNLLRRVNFLIAPHHGSETEGSSFWLSQIMKLSFNSFVGTIFCAPHTSQFQHPNRYIDTILFPVSAKSWVHEIGYYREDKKRRKTTDSSVFITSFAKYGTYWLNLSEDGMSMFSDESGELELLVSKRGWSKYTDRLLDLFYKEDLDTFLPIILNNPQELSVRNAKGETPFIQFLRSNKPLSISSSLSDSVFSNSIINMLLVALLVSDDEIDEYSRDLLEKVCADKLILKNLHDKFKIKNCSFRQSLRFLFKETDLIGEDLEILASLNKLLSNSVLFLLIAD